MNKASLVFLLASLSLASFSQDINWIRFEWGGDSLDHRYFDKLYIKIPVQLDDLPYKFNAQFDLGAVNTMVYGQSFAPYIALHPDLGSKIDTSVVTWVQNTPNPVLKNVSLKLSGVSFGKKDIVLFKNFGDSLTLDSVTSGTEKHIGTIGANLFQDQILIIDYPNKRMAVTEKVPEIYANATFQPIKIHKGRIKIPLCLADSTYDVMFDTGSSMFELVTDEWNQEKCAVPGSAVTDSLLISSWGVHHYVLGRLANKLKFGQKPFPAAKVYLWKGPEIAQFNREEKIVGITGNALFLENVVIIDYKHQRFGVAD